MGAPTASDLIEKAERACRSAQVLLDLGDVDGEANRAYYAIFVAARAALLAANAPVKPDIARTNRGLINAFGDYLVKNGPIPAEVGRLLKRAGDIRMIADYGGESVEPVDAKQIVEQAETFIAAMRTAFLPA